MGVGFEGVLLCVIGLDWFIVEDILYYGVDVFVDIIGWFWCGVIFVDFVE